MEEILYIVIWKPTETDHWQEKTNGVFHDKRLAENFVEILKAQKFAQFIGIVEGPITSPGAMAEAEAALGKF